MDNELFGDRAVQRQRPELGIFPTTIRTASADAIPGAGFTPGNENFQMGAFLKGKDGYIYQFGTPSGRGGAAFLAGSTEPIAGPDQVPILERRRGRSLGPEQSGCGDADLPGAGGRNVGPVQQLPQAIPGPLHRRRQQRRHRTDRAGAAGAVESPQPLVSSFQMPGGIYAPMIHPWSSGRDLYFNLSLWSAYDVMLMHTVLP